MEKSCEELNNSPQIGAAADGRPLTRYAANSRNSVVTARRRQFGDLDGERECLETKDGDRESLETKDGERESLETKKRIMRDWRRRGQTRVPCVKGDNGTPLDFGLSRELWTG